MADWNETGRNEEFLEHSRLYSDSVFGGAVFISMFPSFMKPLVGWIVRHNLNRHLATCKRIGVPTVVERLRLNQLRREKSGHIWEPPVWSNQVSFSKWFSRSS